MSSAQANAQSSYQNGQGWNSIQIDYVHQSMGFSGRTDPFGMAREESFPVSLNKTTGLNGVSASYSRSFGLSKSVPLYLETGLSLQSSFGGSICYSQASGYAKELSDNGNIVEYHKKQNYLQIKDGKYMSLSLPVKLMYQIRLPKGVAVEPFLGLYLRENILGESKIQSGINNSNSVVERIANDGSQVEEYRQMMIYEKDGFDMFSSRTMSQVNSLMNVFSVTKDDEKQNAQYDYCLMDGKGNKEIKGFRNIQFGGMLGANFVLNNKCYLNVSYGIDFNSNHSPLVINETETVKKEGKHEITNRAIGRIESKRVRTLSVGFGIRF